MHSRGSRLAPSPTHRLNSFLVLGGTLWMEGGSSALAGRGSWGCICPIRMDRGGSGSPSTPSSPVYDPWIASIENNGVQSGTWGTSASRKGGSGWGRSLGGNAGQTIPPLDPEPSVLLSPPVSPSVDHSPCLSFSRSRVHRILRPKGCDEKRKKAMRMPMDVSMPMRIPFLVSEASALATERRSRSKRQRTKDKLRFFFWDDLVD